MHTYIHTVENEANGEKKRKRRRIKKKNDAKTQSIDTTQIQINANDLYILYELKCIIQRSKIEWEQTAVTVFVGCVRSSFATFTTICCWFFFIANYL